MTWAIEVDAVSRTFGPVTVLDGVTLRVRPGEVHALLGPNGAGKTTLTRIVAGLTDPTTGRCQVLGSAPPGPGKKDGRSPVGFIPSGDRTFYLRISALENLVFFGRLEGLRRAEALGRARRVLGQVGLGDVARQPVGTFSHGMQKRLSIARALLMASPVLLVDEATHDLDPEGARRIRRILADLAQQGAAVLWTTQRIDEIRGFADRITVLSKGRVAFSGTVPALLAHAAPRNYLLRVRDGGRPPEVVLGVMSQALGTRGDIALVGADEDAGHLLRLNYDVPLGEALQELMATGVMVLACREQESPIEEAFLRLTEARS